MAICYHRVQMDDPYITYRYARNIAEGNGFLYNPGERILGTTAPLYALILALGGQVSDNYPLLSSIASGIALAAVGLLVYRIMAGFGQAVAGGVASVLIVLSPLLGDALGFELNLYLALTLGAFAAYFGGRPNLAALLLGLSTLVRGDGFVPAALILSHHVWVRGWRTWSPTAIYIAVVGGWALYAASVFGTPFPNTLAAKRAMGESQLWQPFWYGALRIGYIYVKLAPFHLWFGVVAVLGCLSLVWMDRRILLIVGWVGLVFAGYWLMGVPEAYNYYAQAIPVLMLVSGLGAVQLADLLASQWPALRSWSGWVLAAVLFPLLVAELTPTFLEIGKDPEPRYRAYRRVGEYLAAATPEGASVGLVEIGIVGYYSRRHIVDVCGLITPGVGQHLAAGDVAWPVRVHRPDYVLLHDPLWTSLEAPIASAPWFSREYKRALTFDAQEPYRLVLYRRTGSHPQSNEATP